MSALKGLSSARRSLLCALYPRKVSLRDRGPLITFTFDDFPRSALVIGGEILKSKGVRGTYYAAMGLMNSVNHLGDMFRRQDIDILLEDGHELGSHTFGHVSCRSVANEVFRQEVLKGAHAVRDFVGKDGPNNFAFPFGEVTATAKQRVGKTVSSSRGIFGGLNGPTADLNLLRANSLYGDLAESVRVDQLICENERRKSWLIFYSHDVSPTPSRFGCTPELLDFAVTRATRGQCRVVTIAEGVSILTT